MKVTAASLVLFVYLVKLGESQPLKVNSGQSPGRFNFDDFYGDFNYDYDGLLTTESQGEEGRNQHDNRDVQPTPVLPQTTWAPHEVLDDENNFDYTYGDPSVDYDFPTSSRDDETHVSTEASNEVDISPAPPSVDKSMPAIIMSIVEWMLKNWEEVRFLRDQWIETKDHVKMSWGRIKHSMKRIRNALRDVLKKFGKEVEEGLSYCILVARNARRNVSEQGSDVIFKLEKLLEEGNEFVAAFFRLIGVKIEAISRQYNGNLVDVGAGSAGSPSGQHVKLATPFGVGETEPKLIDRVAPNLFEDQEVLHKLNSLVEKGVLSLEEVEALLNAAAQQSQGVMGEHHRRIKLV